MTHRRSLTDSAVAGWTLQHAPLLLFGTIVAIFALLSSSFLTVDNAVNILIQSSSNGIVAIGMTFVLLTAGIDLSVGSLMFLAAAIGGKMLLAEEPLPLPLACAAMLAIGAVWGGLQGLIITRFAVAPFIATLAAYFVARGTGLAITQTRAMNLPETLRGLATSRPLDVPVPVWLLAAVVILSHLVLTRTPFGRHVHAVGDDPDAARKAGIPVHRVLVASYTICGLCAVLGGIVALAQFGAVPPNFGVRREFDAIAAAVLGGTSLFGGRGSVLPGTLVGAVLIQTLYNGLNVINTDPYAYPLILGPTIFLAVLLDSLRRQRFERLARRKIRVEEL